MRSTIYHKTIIPKTSGLTMSGTEHSNLQELDNHAIHDPQIELLTINSLDGRTDVDCIEQNHCAPFLMYSMFVLGTGTKVNPLVGEVDSRCLLPSCFKVHT